MIKENSKDKIRAIIIDDELHARENLQLLVEEFCPEIMVCGQADGVKSGREAIIRFDPELVFLDIRMPSGSEGFDLLAQLPEKNFQVIFVTAFKDYAVKALNASALHYILKPIDIDDLRDSVDKLIEYRESFLEDISNKKTYQQSLENLKAEVLRLSVNRKITLFHSRGFKIVNEKDIVYLAADNNCTQLHFKDGTKYLDTKTIKVFEQMLNEESFIRIHKSHIINLDYLKEYSNQNGHVISLEDGTELVVSRARLPMLMEKVKSL